MLAGGESNSPDARGLCTVCNWLRPTARSWHRAVSSWWPRRSLKFAVFAYGHAIFIALRSNPPRSHFEAGEPHWAATGPRTATMKAAGSGRPGARPALVAEGG